MADQNDPFAGLTRRELRELRARLDQAEAAAATDEDATQALPVANAPGAETDPSATGAPGTDAPTEAMRHPAGDATERDPAQADIPTQAMHLPPDARAPEDDRTQAMPLATETRTPAMGVPLADGAGAGSGDGSDGDGPETGDGSGRRWTKKHTKVTIIVAAIVLLLCAAWLGVRALMVKGDLEAAQRVVAHVQQEPESLQASLPVIGEYAASAASVKWDPVWRVAEIIPWAGTNLKAVRLASETLDVAANDLALPALDEMNSDSETPILQRVLPILDDVQPDIASLADAVESVADSGALIGPVRGGIDLIHGVLQSAAPALGVAPGLLGADESRNYLLVFMNNAESVGLAGSAASQTLINVDQGKLEIAAQASSGDFDEFGGPVDVEVPQSALDLYTSYLVDHVNTTPSRPDFPTMAALTRAFWNRDIGDQQIDGVVGIDPIALSYILDATGPIHLEAGDETITMTSDNAVQLLLSDVYSRWGSYEDQAFADAFFAGVAGQVFGKIAAADFDMLTMMTSLKRGIDQGSLLFHSFDDETQSFIADERVSGILPTETDEQSVVGVYFRDESTSKIDYYMKSNIDVTQTCDADAAAFQVDTTLHLDLDQATFDALPDYVKPQNPAFGYGQTRTAVYVYGPPGTTLDTVEFEGNQVEIRNQDIDDLGRPVAFVWVYLTPGELATVHTTFSGNGEFGPAALWSTPMVNQTTGTVDGCGGE